MKFFLKTNFPDRKDRGGIMETVGMRLFLKEQLLSLEMKTDIVRDMISEVESMQENRDIIQELEILKNDFLDGRTYLDGLKLAAFSTEDKEILISYFDLLIKCLNSTKNKSV